MPPPPAAAARPPGRVPGPARGTTRARGRPRGPQYPAAHVSPVTRRPRAGPEITQVPFACHAARTRRVPFAPRLLAATLQPLPSPCRFALHPPAVHSARAPSMNCGRSPRLASRMLSGTTLPTYGPSRGLRQCLPHLSPRCFMCCRRCLPRHSLAAPAGTSCPCSRRATTRATPSHRPSTLSKGRPGTSEGAWGGGATRGLVALEHGYSCAEPT